MHFSSESRKFLRFVFDGNLYQSTSLPFGLCLSPYIFTKVLKPVVSLLSSKGYRSNVYLDDFLLYGSSLKECLRNLHETIKLLSYLGFIINFKKSNLIPTKRCKILGFILDSERFSIELTDEKRVKVLQKN